LWHVHSGAPTISPPHRWHRRRCAGIDPNHVVVHHTSIGGGFGRRRYAAMVIPAVAVGSNAVRQACEADLWPRRLHGDGFHPAATYPKVKAGLDADGKLVGLRTTWSAPGDRALGASRTS